MKEIRKINLQLFADPNVQTTLLANTGNNLSPEMKTFYSKDLIETAGAALVHAQFGDPVSLPPNGGKTMEWRRWSKFKKALTPLTEGVTPDGSPIDVGYITKTVEQFGDYTTVSDVLTMTAIDNVIVEVTEKHAENAGLTLDTIVRNELVQGTNVLFADRVITASEGTVDSKTDYRMLLDENCLLTPRMISRAATVLAKANAPKIDGSYVCIIHPSVKDDLINNKDFIDITKYSDATRLFNHEIGKLHGVRFVESTEACIFHGADLSAGSRNLKVKAYDSASGAITVEREFEDDKGSTAVSAEDMAKLYNSEAGEGRTLILKDVSADNDTYVLVEVTGVDGQKIFVRDEDKDNLELFTPAAGDMIYPGEGGREGKAAYACLFLAKGAFKVVKLNGKNMEIIVKGQGSSGTSDPLNQRSTIGWKAAGFGAKIAINEYIVRVECGSSFSDEDVAN